MSISYLPPSNVFDQNTRLYGEVSQYRVLHSQGLPGTVVSYGPKCSTYPSQPAWSAFPQTVTRTRTFIAPEAQSVVLPAGRSGYTTAFPRTTTNTYTSGYYTVPTICPRVVRTAVVQVVEPVVVPTYMGDQVPRNALDTSVKRVLTIPNFPKVEYQAPKPIDIKVLPPRPVTPPRPTGPPWIGFAVQDNLDKHTIFIKDIAPGGPAEASGLREKDEITTFGGERTLDMNDFRAAVKRHAYAVGMQVWIEYARDDEYGNDNALRGQVMLTVGSKPQKEVITDLPPMNSRQEIDVILNNNVLFDKVTKSVWAAADDDNSGFVQVGEFVKNIRKWMSPAIGRVVTDGHLRQIFETADADGSGRLKKSEAPMLASSILNQAKNLL